MFGILLAFAALVIFAWVMLASHSVWVACLLGLTLMSTAGLLMFCFADELVCLFVGPAQ